jgi:hypothetical protein
LLDLRKAVSLQLAGILLTRTRWEHFVLSGSLALKHLVDNGSVKNGRDVLCGCDGIASKEALQQLASDIIEAGRSDIMKELDGKLSHRSFRPDKC